MTTNSMLKLLIFCLLTSKVCAGINSAIVMNWGPTGTGTQQHSLKVLEVFYLKGKDAVDDLGGHFDAIQRQLYHDAIFHDITENNRPESNLLSWDEDIAGNILNSDKVDSDKARQYFVIGATLFKDVHSTSDYKRVVEAFSKAVELAPKWPDAHYNLALVLEAKANSRPLNRDAAQNHIRDMYMLAILHLKIYLDLHTAVADPKNPVVLSESERGKIQDKIYELKARAQKAQDYVPPPLELAVPTK